MTTKQLGRAVEASDFVRAFKGYGVSQADIAQVVQVDVETVYAWKATGAKPGDTAYSKLEDLREIILALSDSCTARVVGQWVHAQNRILDGQRPLDALREGQQQKALEAAKAFVDGSYV